MDYSVALTLALPVLTAWYVADKVEALRPHWFADPGGVKIPKVEVATLASVVGSLFLLALVGLAL
jgi:hypothetical protein